MIKGDRKLRVDKDGIDPWSIATGKVNSIKQIVQDKEY